MIIYLSGLLSFLLQYFVVFTAQVLHLMVKFILTWFVFHALINEIIFLLAVDCRGIEIKLIFVFWSFILWFFWLCLLLIIIFWIFYNFLYAVSCYLWMEIALLPFPVWCLLFIFCLVTLARPSSTMLNHRGKSQNFCLVPQLK